ncbi:F-box/LRR-repeat protein 20 isoform X1 [Xenopus tropicalis]|uniref:F-box/LRR-repeat protein 2 n=1 Tax=Xenopus tropicalis TaxID=8364 RepID=A0A6I8S822_XENTR|nr:F-box/LRR-repeat protein 20 isoform X1 [Xenopus tropicalis]|eukprot:XP_004918731.1 PREDICTED: F-box/LRR-repeat protein 20 isoform X1 [Xenopus tropicalis]
MRGADAGRCGCYCFGQKLKAWETGELPEYPVPTHWHFRAQGPGPSVTAPPPIGPHYIRCEPGNSGEKGPQHLVTHTAAPMRRDMNGVTKSRFEMFSNNDEALINKKLPKELLLRIFSFLDVVTLCRCAQVSRAWNVLALDGSNWQRIDLFDFQRDIEGRVVENISKRCGGFLRKLSLRGCLGVGDNALRTFAQNCRNIEVLNLNGCTKITDATSTSLSKFCSKLRQLDLASCTSITNLSLKAISEGCPQLEQLNISWCDQISKDGIQALVKGCGGLRLLSLKGCTQLEDEALKFIGSHCPELVTLNLQACSQQITDDGLITICRGCHKLQSLCASGCSNITDSILNALGQNCPRLRILEVARCSQLTDLGFTTLAKNCHELEKMDLEECVQITDSTLIQLSIHCPRLQVLSLSHCELITDDGIRHLGNGACAHDRLEVIELDNCPLITDASLEHLKSCQSLERIELYDCQQISRAGIKRLRTHLPNIKVHAYFAPVTPPPSVGGSRQRFCRCCAIL